MMKVFGTILTFFVLSAGASPAFANQMDDFKSTWKYFLEECGLVIESPKKYMAEKHGDGEVVTAKISDDGNVIAFTKGNGDLKGGRTRYLDANVDVFPGMEVRNCAVFFEEYGRFDSEKLAKRIDPWLSKENGFHVVGGFVPLYDDSTHRFGVIGAWPTEDLPILIYLYDFGIQFYVTQIVRD